MTLVDLAALTAALAELDAERAKVARLRAAAQAMRQKKEDLWVRYMAASHDLEALRQGKFEGYSAALRDIFRALAATEDQP